MVQRRSYVSQQTLLDATQPKGRRYYWKSDYFDTFSTELAHVLLGAAEDLTSPCSAILVMQLGGAMAHVGENDSAVSHRNARYVVNLSASWERPPDGPHIEHELESHSHRAVLDLVLDGWGQPLLWEAGGPPSYDDPEYLTWYQSGRGHNTVLVDDRELTDRLLAPLWTPSPAWTALMAP